LRASLLQYRRVRVEHRQVYLVRREGRDRPLETVVVDHFGVRDVRAVLEKPPRRVGERVIGPRNGIRELDMVPLIRGAGCPLRTAVDGEHDVGI
jgi:hypothetical protein